MRHLWLPGLMLLAGCIVEAPTGDGTPSARQTSASAVSEAPPLLVKSGANFGGKAELVATSVQPGQISPGAQVRVTFFFRALDAMTDNYVVFVHLEDAGSRVQRMNLDHRPRGGEYPTSQWKKGELVRDEFAFTIPPGMTSGNLNLWVGLWEPKSNVRLKLENAAAVPNDGDNRVLAVAIPLLK